MTMGTQRILTPDPKVWRIETDVGPCVIGAAGDAACDAVLMSITWGGGPDKWRRRIAAAARRAECEFDALIGYAGEIYTYSCASLCRVSGSVAAIGSGGLYALGYLEACRDGGPRVRLMEAITGAARHDAWVGGPVQIVRT